MSPAFRIALRYLRAKKSHTAVNVITWISVAGVAVAAMAMVAVLSIFNGFSDLAASHLALIDPELRVERADGRIIANADSLACSLRDMAGVSGAVPILESRALLVGADKQTPVVFRGVHPDYGRLSGIRGTIIEGQYALNVDDADSTSAAVIAVGVANKLLSAPGADRRLTLYVPRRTGRINPANPSAAFLGEPIAVSGIFAIGQNDYDADFIIIPIDAARSLLEYDDHQAGAIEIFTDTDAPADALKRDIASRLGDEYTIKNTIEQHHESFRMIAIEKWITFMMLLFILVIALFNIVSTLSLLVIEKRGNMATLRALGADASMVRRVFIYEGWLVTLLGGLIGIILGIILVLLQQHFGIIRLSGDAASLAVEAYPVRLALGDLAATAAAVTLTGLLASQATRLFLRKSPDTPR